MNPYLVLDQMIEDMKEQSPLYRPTSFWEGFLAPLVQELQEGGIEKFRALPSSLGLFVPTYAFPGYLTDPIDFQPIMNQLRFLKFASKRFSMKMENFLSGKHQARSDYRVLSASRRDFPPFTDTVSESSIGNPVEQFEFDGRRFSRSFLNYLLGISFLKKHLGEYRIQTVMEIGGGFGSLGEILLGDSRNHCFYIDVDIPPLAMVSAWYLGQVFGAEHIGSYQELRDAEALVIEDLKEQYKAVSLCSWQLPKLSGKIDLFVNFISFQEMEPVVVENYCRHVHELGADFVLLRNLREGKPQKADDSSVGVETPILGKDYDRFLPNYELVDVDTTVFGFLTDDEFHSELRLYKRKGYNIF